MQNLREEIFLYLAYLYFQEAEKYLIIEERNIVRQEHLYRACKELRLEESEMFRALMNQDHKLLYCRVNKCASTFVIDLLNNTIDCRRSCLREQKAILSVLPFRSKILLLENAYSFIFVREPYGRIFSYYANRFYAPKESWTRITPSIIQRYRKNPSNLSLTYGYDLTFTEYIQYIIDQTDFEENEHVRPMYSRCNPCQLKYSYIGKLETLSSDIDYLLQQWTLRNITKNIPKDIVQELMDRYLFKPVDNLFEAVEEYEDTPIPVFNLFVRAWTYFQIKGKVSISIQMPFLRSQVERVTKQQFVDKLKLAIQRSKTLTGLKDQPVAAMRQAYSSVPMDLLEKLVNVVEVDCYLFGYEIRPDFLFNQNLTASYDYFRAVHFD